MPVIKVNDQQFPLKPGQTSLGGGDADIAVGTTAGARAMVELLADGRAVVRRASDEVAVRVNGVVLGVEPTPLLHGDRLEIGGQDAYFADDAKDGATQFVSAGEVAAIVAKRAGTARATTATGGRLVSLVDGKEYSIPDSGTVIGREADSDIVVAQTEVSRRHASIAPDDTGYLVRDHSTNGVFVNGTRVEGSVRLNRADVIRVGTEEFRFYADVTAPVKPTPPVAAAPVSPEPPSPAGARLAAADSMPTPAASVPAPAAPASPPAGAQDAPISRPVLAVLEVTGTGPERGRIHEITSPLTHIGRGAYNDIVLEDEGVSDHHAKLQQREGGWYLVDLGSTNGTYVNGERIAGERRIPSPSDIRFAGMTTTTFQIRETALAEGTGTRVLSSVTVPPATQPATPPAAAAERVSAEPPTPDRDGRISPWVIVIAVLLVAGAIAYLLLGR